MVKSGPSDRDDDAPEPGERPAERPSPYPGDVHVAGRGPEPPPDWVHVQGTPSEEPAWEPPPLPPEGPEAPPAALTPEPPAVASQTRPDIPRPAEPPPPQQIPALWSGRNPGDDPGPLSDPQRRGALVDAFVNEFVSSATWRATLAVLESAFPGLGMAASLARRTDELWRSIDTLDEAGPGRLGIPVWRDEGGMAFDLSAHLPSPRAAAGDIRPRASWPYAGAFVIDTLDPLRYHRPVGGPAEPRDRTGEPSVPTPPPGEEEDSGVVIVADLTSAGVRVLDSAALWRHAGRVVTATLHDHTRPETRTRARRALRALRRVVFIDPNLGLGLCLQIDATRTPRCLLAFHVDHNGARSPRFVSL